MALSFTAATTHTKTLTNPSTGSEDKVYGVDYVSASSHTTSVAVAGATAARIPYASSATELTDSANLTYSEASGPRLTVGSGSGTSAGWYLGYGGASGYSILGSSGVTPNFANSALFCNTTTTNINAPDGGNIVIGVANNSAYGRITLSGVAGLGPTITAGTATTAVSAFAATQTWNASGVTFTGIKFTITDTASAAGSLAMQVLGGAAGTTNLFSLDKSGNITFNGVLTSTTQPLYIQPTSGGALQLYTTGAVRIGTASDAGVSYAGTNNLIFSAGTAGGGTATSRAEINKSVTAFTDGAAKTVFTLTIPNAAHSASYLVRLTGSIGAGGAVGANEASATNCYVVTITRTAGVNATAAISAAFGAAATNVAGATTVTCTGALAAVSGAVGATNTIDIQATITKGGGASDNHTCVATASLLNANATGVTIA